MNTNPTTTGPKAPQTNAAETEARNAPATVTPNRTRRWVLIATAAVLLLAGGGVYAYLQRTNELEDALLASHQQYDLLADLNAKTEQEVAKLRLSLDDLSGRNAELDHQLGAARKALAQREATIGKLTREAKTSQAAQDQLRAQLEELQALNQRLDSEREAMRNANSEAVRAMAELKTTLESLQQQNASLQARAEDAGARLGAYGIRLHLLRAKGGNVSEVTRPKQANQLRVEFELGENALAKPGKRALIVRLQAPGVAPKEWKREVAYTGARQKLSFEGAAQERLQPGSYTVTVMEDQQTIGTEAFRL